MAGGEKRPCIPGTTRATEPHAASHARQWARPSQPESANCPPPPPYLKILVARNAWLARGGGSLEGARHNSMQGEVTACARARAAPPSRDKCQALPAAVSRPDDPGVEQDRLHYNGLKLARACASVQCPDATCPAGVVRRAPRPRLRQEQPFCLHGSRPCGFCGDARDRAVHQRPGTRPRPLVASRCGECRPAWKTAALERAGEAAP